MLMATGPCYCWEVQHRPTDGDRDLRTGRLSVPKALSTYLSDLSEKIPATTKISHEQKLTKFKNWLPVETITPGSLERLAAIFIKHLLEHTEYATDSIKGYVSVLSNFIGYLWPDDPELVAARLQREFHEISTIKFSGQTESVFDILNSNRSPSGSSKREIERVISYLRRSRFGSRTQAFVEVILEVKARPSLVRWMNRSDFAPHRGVITVEISDQFLVGRYDLVTKREAKISANLKEALSDYIERDRNHVPVNAPKPLFTTSQGRASESTLRRSLRRTSENLTNTTIRKSINETKSTDSESSAGDSCTVLPSDIWWYALSSIIE
jgi:hypothetical protein